MSAYTLSPGFLRGIWKAAHEAYLEDRVEDAYTMIEEAAAGFQGEALSFYRLLEGEAQTRKHGHRAELTDKLELEWIPVQIPHHGPVGHVLGEATKRVTQRLQWDDRKGVLATILTQEADALWNHARYGYCVSKIPYDKICLPWQACQNPYELFRVTSHEFAHVVVLNTALEKAPHWLDEGIACLMEGRSPLGAKQRLTQAGTWLEPEPLDRAFNTDRRDASNLGSVGAAYDQATVLVAYLHSLKGDAGVVELLKRLGNQPVLTELFNRVLNHDQTDQPLHHVYGFGEAELFERAGVWTPPADPIPAK